MNAHPGDNDGQPGTVYLLHFEPAYRHARHYLGWTAENVDARLQTHLDGQGSPLIRAAAAAGVDVQVARPTPAAATSSDASSAGTTAASSVPPAANAAADAPADAHHHRPSWEQIDAMTLNRQPQAGTARLVAALEDAWRAIAANHADLPPAAIIVGQGSGRRGGGLILGHFAAERWQHADAEQGSYVHEVLIGGEGLQRGAPDVLATLLHEAAHAIATVREIADTSRQGRYHNARYKTLAEELGLHVERDTVIGWSLTSLPDATAARYAPAITALQRAITLHRRVETTGPGGGTNLSPATCSCPRRIRVAPGTLAAGPILCTICSQPFALVDHAG